MDKWDEVVIGTEDMKNIISKLINKILKKQLQCDVDIQLNELTVTDKDEKLHAHLSIDAEISMNELEELLNRYNVI